MTVHRGGQQDLSKGFSAADGGVSKDPKRKATMKEARPGAASKRSVTKMSGQGIGVSHSTKGRSGIAKTNPFDMAKSHKTEIPKYNRAPQS